MAAAALQPRRRRQRLLLLLALLLHLHALSLGAVAAAPFRARDVLPLLPRRLAWQLMGATAHSAVDLLPSFVAAVAPGGGPASWRGACFAENEAVLSLTPGAVAASRLGGAVLRLKTASPESWTCMDLYVFATPYRIGWDYYMRSNENHTFEIKAWEEAEELEYVKQHGIAVFLMPSGMLGTLLSLIDVIPLFSNTGWGQDANLAFLQKHMGTSFQKRTQPWSANIRKEDVHSGDFLALSKIRGRWGGFQTLEKWVTGAFAGHTAVFLKDKNGTLWVAESGYENKKGDEIISMTPWEEWWGMALKDDSNPQIALLPLQPDVRARFNESAAWDFARSMYGKPYGYHNMIFSWIDTMSDNYPPPLDANLVMAIMSMWTRLQPHYASNMWNEALNKRLGTEKLDLHGIITETERRGLSFNQLLTIPERDDWEYSDGKSTTCVAFILSMYKAAGVFAPFTDSIQVTEFTIRDAYMLKIFEDNQTRLPGWCNAAADRLPFCQILGEYKMDLPEYNTIEPYANMNENCPSAPPAYNRPARC
ncbi:hypothetical protein HU200_033414 [Digitaria exilis]|uniref:Uncharacterized protein n=1 Tax=Digitaria exilis TaxID=1010633 RepID=A0A835BSE2_9POAL|nr:hypothetical protein HU200_033414 [Digitaria exilis]